MTANLRLGLAALALLSLAVLRSHASDQPQAPGDAGFLEAAQALGRQVAPSLSRLQREQDAGGPASYRAVREGKGWRCRDSRGVEGFNRANLEVLKRDRWGECMILGAVRLSLADLKQANLRAARLEEADLQLAQLDSAVLDGAWLHHANLSQASLAGASLQGAFLHSTELSLAQLPGANLSSASLLDADLAMANLTEARLTGANLFDVNLAGAGLEGAVLEGAWLALADLRRAKLARAVLRGATFAWTDIRGAELDEALGWEEANWAGAIFNDETRLPFSRETALAKGMRGVALPTGADLPRNLAGKP